MNMLHTHCNSVMRIIFHVDSEPSPSAVLTFQGKWQRDDDYILELARGYGQC